MEGRKKEDGYIYIYKIEGRKDKRRERKREERRGEKGKNRRSRDSWLKGCGLGGGKEDRIEGMITFVSYLTLERAG